MAPYLIKREGQDAGTQFMAAVSSAEQQLASVGAPGYQKALLALESIQFMLEREADASMISGAFRGCLLEAARKGLA